MPGITILKNIETNMGYKDRAEYGKIEYFWNKGFHLPEEFNDSCSSHFGKWLGERLIKK